MFKHTGRLLAPIRPFSRRFSGPAGIFLGASGALCCLFAAQQTIYLDRLPGSDSGITLSSLKRRKSTNSFDLSQPTDVERNLREHEESHIADKSTGISRFDIVQVSSNDPNEDDHATATLPRPKGSWSFFVVLDGHSGWETSTWLREKMIPAVASSLADFYEKRHASNSESILSAAWRLFGGDGEEKDEDAGTPIDDSIKGTFKRLDDEIVHRAVDRVFSTTSKNAGVNLLAPAYSGSCALLAFYDSHTRLLRIAVTGDSRAILGRRMVDDDGKVKYKVEVLSVDQDGNNKFEIERLNNSPEHPGEEVVKDGRVLGMGPSRAFGDARWKWPVATQKRLHREYLGRSIRADVKTPPYLTAEPVVTTTKVERGDFLVMGTDGLWECLQNEEAVGLVGAWLDRKSDQHHSEADKGVLERTVLPVMLPEHDTTVRYAQWAAKKTFVNIDGNAATHLARNALGGADTDLAKALLSMRAPRGRTYRDDITALVVFFDNDS